MGLAVDIESGVAAETIGTFRTIPESPKMAHRFIQANPVMGAKGVSFPLSVDGMSLFFHGWNPAKASWRKLGFHGL
jgi:hypothetical protein